MDPIANMLIMLKNASLVNKASVTFPHSKMKEAVLTLLKEEGYVKAVKVEGDIKKTITVALEYKGRAPRISGVTRISKSSKRVYTGVKSVTPVRYGHGLLVLSTPKGILTDKMARKEMVGGEVLFSIW